MEFHKDIFARGAQHDALPISTHETRVSIFLFVCLMFETGPGEMLNSRNSLLLGDGVPLFLSVHYRSRGDTEKRCKKLAKVDLCFSFN